jgi:hypothetical protein
MQRGLSISVGGVLVNNKGVDFGQQGLSDAEWFAVAVSQPDSTYRQVFDDKQKQNFWVSGTDWANPATIRRVLFDDPSLIKRAGTLAELAQTTGLPFDPLTKSVMEYNEDHKTKIQTPPFKNADGEVFQSKTFVIRSLKIGNIEAPRVQAKVSPSNAPPLLGQSFLKRFKSWSIDNSTQELILQR